MNRLHSLREQWREQQQQQQDAAASGAPNAESEYTLTLTHTQVINMPGDDDALPLFISESRAHYRLLNEIFFRIFRTYTKAISPA